MAEHHEIVLSWDVEDSHEAFGNEVPTRHDEYTSGERATASLMAAVKRSAYSIQADRMTITLDGDVRLALDKAAT